MKSLHILHLEDDPTDAMRIVNLLSKNYQLTVVTTVNQAMAALKESPFDLAILDIEIDGRPEGIELAGYLSARYPDISVIFLTNLQSKAIFDEAKLTRPFSYLFKPFNAIELQYTIELALEKHFGQERTLRKAVNAGVVTPMFLFVKRGNSIFKLSLDDITYIEVAENYSTLHTSDHQKYLVSQSLTKLKEILPAADFIQVHRKSMVNLKKIREINLSENTIYLTSDQMVAISERYKKHFADQYRILK